jgi:hypothetical protein
MRNQSGNSYLRLPAPVRILQLPEVLFLIRPFSSYETDAALLLAAYLNLFKSRKRQLQGREDGAVCPLGAVNDFFVRQRPVAALQRAT